MKCKSCAERTAAMKAAIAERIRRAIYWARVRGGKADQPAGDPPAQHEQQDMEGDTAEGASEGRLSMSDVRSAIRWP